jgi:uncharacterized protein (DUF302 family)
MVQGRQHFSLSCAISRRQLDRADTTRTETESIHRMVRSVRLTAAALVLMATNSAAQGGTESYTTVASASSFDSTLAHLERAITSRGLTIAVKIDHAAAARKANLMLPPTTLVIAGNPAVGTPLMQADQKMALDLPLRFLVWQAPGGSKASVSYEPIKAIAARHGLTGKDELLGRMTAAISAIVADATK